MSNLIGQRFGRLVVIGDAGTKRSKGGHTYRMWRCKCDCGKYKDLATGNLTSGNTRSCGCLKADRNVYVFTTHGESKTKLYRVWSSIKDRCYRENCKGYADYGARGIRMCESWKDDFQKFHDWAIESGYREGLTIERKDVDGNYCPENCIWIPKCDQSKNRRNSHFITYHGETKTLSEWSRELRIDRGCVRDKEKELGDGALAIDAILNSPKHKMKVEVEYMQVIEKSIKDMKILPAKEGTCPICAQAMSRSCRTIRTVCFIRCLSISRMADILHGKMLWNIVAKK